MTSTRSSVGQALVELQELTERLRRECPWDREQTAKTIVPHTVEEAYEVADAALADDDAKLLDEVGDLLFQAYFLSLLLEERGTGSLEAAARGVHAKLVSRHPHVFGEVEAGTAGRVRQNWERIKREEEGRSGVFHDVPESLPGLLKARKVQRRAAAVGFEYPDVAGALADLEDELRGAEGRAARDRPRARDRAVAARRGRARRPVVRVRERRAQAERRPRAGASRERPGAFASGSRAPSASRLPTGSHGSTAHCPSKTTISIKPRRWSRR